MTNCSWDELGPLNPTQHIAIGIFLISSGFVSGLAALFGLYVYIKDSALHTPSAIPEMGLLLGDLCVAGLHPFSGTCALVNRWIWGPAGCQLYAVGGFLFGNFQMMTVGFIAFDRYIELSGKYLRRYRTVPFYRKIFAILFIATTFFALAPVFGWARYAITPVRISCTIDWTDKGVGFFTYNTTILICIAMGPIALAALCYFNIWHGLKKSKTIDPSRLHWASMGSLGFTSLGCLSVTHICFSIFGLVVVWAFVSDPKTIPLGLSASPPTIAKLAGLLNPIFYMYLNPGFCAAAKRVWNGNPRSESPVPLSTATTERNADPKYDPNIPLADPAKEKLIEKQFGHLERMASKERMKR